MVYRLETERLRLREWLPEDREPLAAMNADRRVMEFFPHPLSRAESDAFFDRIVAEWAESGRGLYAVERRGDGRLIGLTGLHRAAFEASFTPCIEIGWRFVAEVWGQGYATEAARAVLHDAFGRLGLPRVYSFTAALMLKGVSPGAALVLLMAGPATNTASILVIGKVLVRRTLAAYLGAIVAGAVGFGLAIDYLLPAAWFVPSGAVHAACHGEAGYSWVEVASSALLAALLAYALMKRFIHRKNDTSMTKQIYRVGGMSCNHCKASVEKNLALLPSVTAVEVDLTAGTVAVEGTADAAGIQKVIEELGFEYKGRA